MSMTTARRWLLIAFVAVLVLLIAVRLSLPFAVKQGFSAWFKQQGMDAQIADVTFDFSDARIRLIGIQAKRDDTTVLQLDSIELQWSWQALRQHNARIVSLTLNGLRTDIKQTGDSQLTVAGMDLSAPAEQPASLQQADAAPPPDWRASIESVTLNDFNICYQNSSNVVLDYCLTFSKLAWYGNIEYDLAQSQSNSVPLNANGNFSIHRLKLHNRQLDRTLLHMQQLSLVNVSVDTLDNIQLGEITLAAVSLMQRADAKPAAETSYFDKLSIKDLVFTTPASLSVASINIDNHRLAFIKQDNGRFEYEQWLPQLSASADTSSKRDSLPTTAKQDQPQTAETKNKPFVFHINSIDYRSNASLLYIDNSLHQPFRVDINHTELTVRDVDNSQPQQPVMVTVQAMYNQHGKISLQGTILPFTAKPSFDLKGRLAGIDLRSISAFTRETIGHTIKSGQLDADLSLLAEQGMLDSRIKLALHHFEFRALSKQDAEKLDASFGFPLNTSLALLKDRDDSIRLTIPVTGDLDNPEFDPQDAINKALSKAVTAAVINYYTPFGLVMAADSLISLATALRFDPVLFAAGSAELEDTATQQLDKIVSLMQQRPGVRLTLCGYSNRADRIAQLPDTAATNADQLKLSTAQLDQLSQLAAQRAERIKQYLVEHKVDASRLILCEPEYSESADNSGVEISI